MQTFRFQTLSACAATCFLFLALSCPANVRAAIFNVTEDTYIDSRNNTTNYGTVNGLKAFVNDGSPEPARVLIGLPAAMGSIPVGDIASAKLWVFNYGFTPLNRAIELHPLTTSFTETGATWNTSDGTTPWTTSGGDFGTNHIDVTDPVVDFWYAFDITAMLKGADRANLLNNGALLNVFDDFTSPLSTTGQNFVSSENSRVQHPYFEILPVPEPSTGMLLLLGATALLVRRRSSTQPYRGVRSRR